MAGSSRSSTTCVVSAGHNVTWLPSLGRSSRSSSGLASVGFTTVCTTDRQDMQTGTIIGMRQHVCKHGHAWGLMCSGSYICPACTAHLYPTNTSKDITPLLTPNWLPLKFLANSMCSVQHLVEMKRRNIGPSPQHPYFVPHFPLLICFSSLVQQSN